MSDLGIWHLIFFLDSTFVFMLIFVALSDFSKPVSICRVVLYSESQFMLGLVQVTMCLKRCISVRSIKLVLLALTERVFRFHV